MSTTTSAIRHIVTATLAAAARIGIVVASSLAPAVIAFVQAAPCVDAFQGIERATIRHEKSLRLPTPGPSTRRPGMHLPALNSTRSAGRTRSTAATESAPPTASPAAVCTRTPLPERRSRPSSVARPRKGRHSNVDQDHPSRRNPRRRAAPERPSRTHRDGRIEPVRQYLDGLLAGGGLS